MISNAVIIMLNIRILNSEFSKPLTIAPKTYQVTALGIAARKNRARRC